MSDFSSYSHFHPTHGPGSHEKPAEENLRDTPPKVAVQYVGRPNIVEVPKRDLEDIVHNLRQITTSLDIEDAQLESDIEDAASRLASFLPG